MSALRSPVRGRGRDRRVPLLVLVGLVSALAGAAAYPWLDLDARLERADDVFVGTVVRVATERRGDDPWTVVTLRVEHWLLRAGEPTREGPDETTLTFLGGDVAGVTPRQVAGLPTFAEGARHLVARYDAAGLASPLVGFALGLWTLSGGAWVDVDGRALALDEVGGPTLGDDGAELERWLEPLRARLETLRSAP